MFKQFKACDYIQVSGLNAFDGLWLKGQILLLQLFTHIRLSHPHQGQRNVFTTGQAKLDPENYAIKCVGSR